jgi:hypothetical protein
MSVQQLVSFVAGNVHLDCRNHCGAPSSMVLAEVESWSSTLGARVPHMFDRGVQQCTTCNSLQNLEAIVRRTSCNLERLLADGGYQAELALGTVIEAMEVGWQLVIGNALT